MAQTKRNFPKNAKSFGQFIRGFYLRLLDKSAVEFWIVFRY
ncbi:hypothetical protein HMPREF9065_01691 [Aggregatibacter sp. oral taxon 458 str. W10330]|nr:hypothetical protein HMPREF9065_01691 [Aggregatibacter sp. oral taxon 458 str. W10330]